MIYKLTSGFVIQTFSDSGILIAQEFVAGDNVEYEDEAHNLLDLPSVENIGNFYHPFNMQQPFDE